MKYLHYGIESIIYSPSSRYCDWLSKWSDISLM